MTQEKKEACKIRDVAGGGIELEEENKYCERLSEQKGGNGDREAD